MPLLSWRTPLSALPAFRGIWRRRGACKGKGFVWLWATLTATVQPVVWAQATVASAAPDLGALTQQWLDDALVRTPPAGLPLRMEVHVGHLDPRLRLAPCGRVEPYLPVGVRLWGRARIGLRCADGMANWNVFLPVTIKAFGPAWVLNANVPPGTPLTSADAVEAEVDWAAESASVLVKPEQWVGQQASRQLLAGQALRQAMVRPAPLFTAGAQVRVIAQGNGYAVTAAGQALNAAGVGQTVRVRMDNGRLVQGVVRESGAVELAL